MHEVVTTDYVLARKGDQVQVCVRIAKNRKSEAKLLGNDMADDVRVLPIRWRGGARRGRHFSDAVEEMERHGFGDWPVEGEATASWYLQEITRNGEGPDGRHHTWVTHGRIPLGDRSIHEHFVICKALEYAVEIDQLNIPTLLSFEMFIRRAQLIEQAHASSPSNPDYSNSEFYTGWGPQRGAAFPEHPRPSN